MEENEGSRRRRTVCGQNKEQRKGDDHIHMVELVAFNFLNRERVTQRRERAGTSTRRKTTG